MVMRSLISRRLTLALATKRYMTVKLHATGPLEVPKQKSVNSSDNHEIGQASSKFAFQMFASLASGQDATTPLAFAPFVAHSALTHAASAVPTGQAKSQLRKVLQLQDAHLGDYWSNCGVKEGNEGQGLSHSLTYNSKWSSKKGSKGLQGKSGSVSNAKFTLLDLSDGYKFLQFSPDKDYNTLATDLTANLFWNVVKQCNDAQSEEITITPATISGNVSLTDHLRGHGARALFSARNETWVTKATSTSDNILSDVTQEGEVSISSEGISTAGGSAGGSSKSSGKIGVLFKDDFVHLIVRY